MSGYYKIWRKMRNHPLFKIDHKARHFFQDLLGDAAFNDTVQDWRGQPVEVKRGTVMKSQRQMADDYGFSRQEIRTILNRLENYQIVKINPLANRGPMLISVCNWDKYQIHQPTHNPTANPLPTQSQPIKEEGEEVKQERLSSVSDEIQRAFEKFQAFAEHTKLPKPKGLDAKRKKKIKARLDTHGIDGWVNALRRAAKSDFIRDGSWFTIDWLASNDSNIVKVLEGNYDNAAAKPVKTREEQATDNWFDDLQRKNRVGEYAVHGH